MIKCTCGCTNNEDNKFCRSCGRELTETDERLPDNYVPMQMGTPVMFPQHNQQTTNHTKPPFSIFDVLTLFGFVSSIIGCICIALVFEPAALISGFLGFKKGKRYKPLAISAIIISIISFIIQLFITLYRAGLINKWFIEGVFH